MIQNTKINVSLDPQTVQSLLNTLHQGAKKKTLRVVRSAEGSFYVESKELRIVIESNASNTQLKRLYIHNDKLYSELFQETLDKMGFGSLAGDVVRELADKYSSSSHSLADNIYAFTKTYGH